jgi:hypothetical protein
MVEGGAAALAPACVREDEEMLGLVAQLSTLAERDRLAVEDIDVLRATVSELSAAVQLQDIERRLGEMRARMDDGVPGDDDAVELKRLRALKRDLDPRSRARGEGD